MISDEEWLKAIQESVNTRNLEIEGIRLPSFPKKEIVDLTITNGNSNKMLQGAFKFYKHVLSCSENLGQPLNQQSKVLDFGCAWGRIARFFLRELKPEGLYGVDVVPTLVETISESFAGFC